jgi:hypothetical protein
MKRFRELNIPPSATPEMLPGRYAATTGRIPPEGGTRRSGQGVGYRPADLLVAKGLVDESGGPDFA